MEIQEIKVNAYGKLKDKNVSFDKGLNIVYGKNESGKSTLLHFIVNSLYGISKNKKGKEYSDFEQYEPWQGEEFSGKLSYSLDNGKKYEVYRDFRKKNPKIFNEDMEDISKEFTIDKAKGNNFFYDQTKVDEDLFLSTVLVNQQEVKLQKGEQNILIQKIANLVGTGEDNVSYRIAMDRIVRRQRDQIGSGKSREKPINVLQVERQNLELEKNELQGFREEKYNLEDKRNELTEDLEVIQNESSFVKELKSLNDNENLQKQNVKVKENIVQENLEKSKKIEKDLEEKKLEYDKIKKSNEKQAENLREGKKKVNVFFLVLTLVFIIIDVLLFIMQENHLLGYIFLPVILLLICIGLGVSNSKNKKIKQSLLELQKDEKKIREEQMQYENEYNILKENIKGLEAEIAQINQQFDLDHKLKTNVIKEKFSKILSEDIMNEYLSNNNISTSLEVLQNEENVKKLEIHKIDLDRQNIEPKLDSLFNVEEKLEDVYEKIGYLENLNKSMVLAKEMLEKSYEEMKDTVTPKFTQNLSSTIDTITDGKYRKVKYNDEQGLVVSLENGDYVLANKLSIGTIDQLYLSLRLSMLDELSEETMPIILDEAFAYFDTDRLRKSLEFLLEQAKNRQIIIFTCTRREKEILDNLQKNYNFIEINN